MTISQAKPRFRVEGSINAPKSWVFYLLMGLALNQSIWAASFAYLKLTSPAYTSKWAIAIAGVRSSTNVSLPGIGETSSSSDSSYSSQTADPRENYKYLAENYEVLQLAANQLNMSREKFGKPQVKILDNSALLEFEMDGNTPKQAQLKALALQNALATKLEQIRSEEVAQQNKNTENSLESAKQKLEVAQQSLSNFKAGSLLSSNGQLQDLTSNLEGLRRQQAETVAELQQVEARFQQLTNDLGLSTPQAVDALVLQSDSVFQQYLADYSKVSAELIQLTNRFLSPNPVLLSKQQEQELAQAALLQRSQLLLKRPISQDTLKQLALSGSSSSGSSSERANLLQELISLRGQQQGLEAQAQGLNQQIVKLESRLTNLSQEESKLDSFQRDVKIAEAVFSSSLTKQQLSKANISASYPPASLVVKPSLPEDASAPKKNIVLLGTAMSSLFFTTGTTLLWLRDRKIQEIKEKQKLRLPKH